MEQAIPEEQVFHQQYIDKNGVKQGWLAPKNVGNEMLGRVTSSDGKHRRKKEINSQFKHSDSEKLELMEKYYKIKQINPKLNVIDIAKRLNISPVTLYKWKKQFDSNLNKNSVNENSLPENSPTFTDNDTSEHPMPSSDDNLWAWNLVKKKRTERIQVDTLREEIKTK
uniref:Transposase n=1 Tax=Globodera rostochiensis TaxID=31243 RepID=A0A914HYP0_GLORO